MTVDGEGQLTTKRIQRILRNVAFALVILASVNYLYDTVSGVWDGIQDAASDYIGIGGSE